MSLNPLYPDAIYPLLQSINEAVQPPCPTSTDNNCTTFKSEVSRRKLISAAEQLLLAARSPEENVFAIAQQPAQTTALRCVIALGIPDALPENGSPRSLDNIASEVGADKILLSRILRACTSTSLLAEASELHYAHNLSVVDLGGGRGQALIDMREDHPGLLQGARLVLVDLGPVIDSAREAGLPPWVEPVKGSFFEPLHVRGADVYLLRRCLQDWDDAACRRILNNGAAAMDPARSRLLVTDMVVADTNAAREMA
ncbi:hypothetical protein LA080_000386 [Diaporthe eres]|uniref:O-methyltransferase domain-containing protein n=1 Tax=Diaporthe vaccinii TaxID=105482 RepID=A0ABR4EEI8_9PEZI|nr:hypothetical protein LA080_000386 [Diaporthe eres]